MGEDLTVGAPPCSMDRCRRIAGPGEIFECNDDGEVINLQNIERRQARITELEQQLAPLRRALAKAALELLLTRDCLYETTTTAEGAFMDEDDEESVGSLDRLIDECCAALGCQVGELAELQKSLPPGDDSCSESS